MKRQQTTYWILLILFSLMMLMDGISGLMQLDSGKEAFDQLHYPYYLMGIIGTAKILGTIGLLQPKYKTLKEWAFAGFTFNFLGASASWALSGGPAAFVAIPLVMLIVLLAIYLLWKRIQQPTMAA